MGSYEETSTAVCYPENIANIDLTRKASKYDTFFDTTESAGCREFCMQLLSGWKEIADFLHLTVRTAQRWERLGLPVHRPSKSRCSPVVAASDEIAHWARQRETRVVDNLSASMHHLSARYEELKSAQIKARRKTRRLMAEVEHVQNEHRRLLRLIRSSLRQGAAATPRARPSRHDSRAS